MKRLQIKLWAVLAVLAAPAVSAQYAHGNHVLIAPPNNGDVTSWLQSQLNATSPGDTIEFLKGTTFNITQVIPPDQRTYTGGATINATGSVPAFNFKGVTSKITVDGLTFNNRGANFDNTVYLRFQNCTFNNIGGGERENGSGIFFGAIRDSVITGNAVYGVQGWVAYGGYGLQRTTISHNYAKNAAQDTIHTFGGQGQGEGNVIDSNVSEGNQRIDFEIQDYQPYSGIVISNNYVRNHSLNWVPAGTNNIGMSYSVPTQQSTGTQVIGNYCDATCSEPLEYMSNGGIIANNFFDTYRGPSQSGSQRNTIMWDGSGSAPITISNNVIADITGVHGGPNGSFPKITGFPSGTTIVNTTYVQTVPVQPVPPAGPYYTGGATGGGGPNLPTFTVSAAANSTKLATITVNGTAPSDLAVKASAGRGAVTKRTMGTLAKGKTSVQVDVSAVLQDNPPATSTASWEISFEADATDGTFAATATQMLATDTGGGGVVSTQPATQPLNLQPILAGDAEWDSVLSQLQQVLGNAQRASADNKKFIKAATQPAN